jgi:hypothetical protein
VGVIAEIASLDQLVCFIWLYSNGLSSQTDEAEGLLIERGASRPRA